MEANTNKTLRERWREISKSDTFPRTVITVLFLVIMVIAAIQGLNITTLMSDSIVRFGMNAILVLAMVPAIKSGIGPNFGLPVGVLVGLLGTLISFQNGYVGWWGFGMAIVYTLPIAIIVGVLYGIMLNRVKGSEIIVSTYTGFSAVFLMSIGWIWLPFTDARMAWPLGGGLRNVISLDGIFGKLLNDSLSIKLLKDMSTGNLITLFNKTEQFVSNNFDSEQYRVIFSFPTAMILFLLAACFLVWLYTKSRSGVMLKAAGDNPKFAAANGINVDIYRIIGATMSTILGAVGIIVYSQSYGYMQLYQGPLMVAFTAVAAILIGGGSVRRATILHVLIGTFLLQALLTVALPTVNTLFPEGNLSEVLRVIVQYGVILYALTQVGSEN